VKDFAEKVVIYAILRIAQSFALATKNQFKITPRKYKLPASLETADNTSSDIIIK